MKHEHLFVLKLEYLKQKKDTSYRKALSNNLIRQVMQELELLILRMEATKKFHNDHHKVLVSFVDRPKIQDVVWLTLRSRLLGV